MPDYLSFDGLLAIPVATQVEQDLEIPGWGTVRVRAMSTAEYWQGRASAREGGEFDDERWQAIVMSMGMAQPKMSYDEALRFSRSRPYGLVQLIVGAISNLTLGIPAGAVTEELVDAAEASFRG